ncbi:MAG: hypothetical protein RIR70_606 [Pseudomonadota bacterium]|jgi:hypothetical protein
MNHLKHMKRQLGVTILEFIAFVGLAALVIAGALMLYNIGNTGAKATEFLTGLHSLAMGARQLGQATNGQNVSAASISPPALWQPAGSGWTYDGATIVFTNNNDGSFSLQVSGLRSTELAQQLEGKSIFQVIGQTSGSYGVSWNTIKFL